MICGTKYLETLQNIGNNEQLLGGLRMFRNNFGEQKGPCLNFTIDGYGHSYKVIVSIVYFMSILISSTVLITKSISLVTFRNSKDVTQL